MKEVYVVAIPHTGGAWLSTSTFYTSYEDADKKLQQDRERGITYTKIFTLREAAS